MKPYMSGKKGPDRKDSFCVGAKICSGKARSADEARQLCSQPKPEGESKPGKGRGKKFNPRDLALCLIENLSNGDLTVASLSGAIATCQEAKKPYLKKHYIRDCIKDGTIVGTMAETVKLAKGCEREWREKNEPEAVAR